MLFKLQEKIAARILPDDTPIREEVIHGLIEENLSEFFEDLTFVCTKLRVDGKEIDTLAFDRSSRTPVIIEYKRGKDRLLVGQIAEYCAKVKHSRETVRQKLRDKQITEDDGEIDYDNPQVYVVAKDFTRDQVQGFGQLRVHPHLFRFQFYSQGIVSLEEISQDEGNQPKPRHGVSATVPAAGGPYNLDHFHMKAVTRQTYDLLDKRISELDSRVKPAKINKQFIGFRATGRYFCTIKPTAKVLHVYVKCKGSPAQATGLKVKKLPADRWEPMTHTFDISVERQVQPALRIIRGALEDSI